MSPLSLHLDLPQDVEDCSIDSDPTYSPSPSRPSTGRIRTKSASLPPRKGDPSYIPRPENAFILFRKDAVAKIRAREAEEAAAERLASPSDKLEKCKRQRQADMSKNISHLWKSLTREERSQWEAKAAQIKREHEQKHPEYRYQPARPGTTGKRASVSSKSRSRVVQRRALNSDNLGGLSEDLSIVVRASRAPRRSSVSSVASSNSSISMVLPSVPSLDYSLSTTPYSRPLRHGRQWVQPPPDDPSPPASEMYFPRGQPSGLAEYNDRVTALQPSPIILPEPKPSVQRRRHSHFVEVNPRSNREEGGAVFVEPITSDRNPWTPGGSKHPSTPRRARANRARSHSQPVQPNLMDIDTTLEIASRSNAFYGWPHEVSVQHSPEEGYYSDSRVPFGSHWSPGSDSEDYYSHSPSTSSPSGGYPLEYPGFQSLSVEEWSRLLEPHEDQLSTIDPTGLFGYPALPVTDDEMESGYTVANFDSAGRQHDFF